MILRKSIINISKWVILSLVVLVNWIAYNQSYSLTHFLPSSRAPKSAFIWQLIFGLEVRKPQIWQSPKQPHQVVRLPYNIQDTLSAWHVASAVSKPKGVFLMFHGYASSKAELVPYTEYFVREGYHVLAVDFRAHGESTGYYTSIGYHESEDVHTACRWARQRYPNLPIYLYGISMGASTILKSLRDTTLPIKAALLECPFGSVYRATEGKLRNDGLPTFPTAALLTLWGSVNGGYWAFAHSPAAYAKEIKVPVLLMRGADDTRVTAQETQDIYANLSVRKQLHQFDGVKHEPIIHHKPEEWKAVVQSFLNK